MTEQSATRLLLDEMFSPTIAAVLRQRDHDVVAVAESADLRAMADEDLFAWSAAQGRWLLTENVKDFRPIMLRALQTSGAMAGLLFTSSRAFPRSRQNPGPLIEALHAWLKTGAPASPITEDWLLGVDE